MEADNVSHRIMSVEHPFNAAVNSFEIEEGIFDQAALNCGTYSHRFP